MNLESVFCPHPDCPLAGQTGEGNITIHSRKEGRYRCKACGRTFSARQGTVFYRKQTPVEVMTVVLTLLAYGCPIPAVVAAFGLDERTVSAWLLCAGSHCQAVHERVVQAGRVELEHVQADELWVKRVGGKLWLAMAICPGTGPSLCSPRLPALAGGCAVGAAGPGPRPCRRRPHPLVWEESLAAGHHRWVDALQGRVPPGLPLPGADGEAGTPEASSGGGVPDGTGREVVSEEAGDGRGSARRAGDAGADRSRRESDGRRNADPHRLHRAVERDLPQPSRSAGAAHPKSRPEAGDASGRDVPRRRCLQLLRVS